MLSILTLLISFWSGNAWAEDAFYTLTTTWLKRAPEQASSQPSEDVCKLPKDRSYAVKAVRHEGTHLFVKLDQAPENCCLQEGYIYQRHVTYRGNIPSGVRLYIPRYFYQWYNQNAPGSTCGITSAAMLMSALSGKVVTPDEVFWRYGTHTVGQSPEGLERIYWDYGAQQAGSTRHGSFEEIRMHLNRGEPVVVHGYFTGGHIVLISGYNSKGFLVQDPAGEWARYNYGGYPNAPYDPKGGRDILYTYSQMEKAIYEPSDQSLWMSWAYFG